MQRRFLLTCGIARDKGNFLRLDAEFYHVPYTYGHIKCDIKSYRFKLQAWGCEDVSHQRPAVVVVIDMGTVLDLHWFDILVKLAPTLGLTELKTLILKTWDVEDEKDIERQHWVKLVDLLPNLKHASVAYSDREPVDISAITGYVG